jgi:hypothetical protein
MRRTPFLAFTVLLCVGCADRPASRSGDTVNANAAVVQTVASATAASTSAVNPQQSERDMEVPAEFREVDFGNFSYPAIVGGKRLRLKAGSYEHRHSDGAGGDTFNFRDVSFADITGDGKKEAIVQLHVVSCGVSCDGGSHLFYFYTNKNGRPSLLDEIGTGSLAYECGLKSFVLEKRKLTVEGFRECRYSDGSLRAPVSGKFFAGEFTRFEFEFNGKRFALKEREVMPFPEGSTLNYRPNISVSDE